MREIDELLLHASHTDNIKLIQELIDAGANVNAQNNYGRTALMYASYNRHPECVRLLLEAGANPLLKTNFGTTAYDLAETPKIKELIKVAMNAYSMMPLFVDAYRKSNKPKMPLSILREVHKTLGFGKKKLKYSRKKKYLL